jgi:hypothetical protein
MPNEAAVKTVETIARAHAELFVRGPVLACTMRAIGRPGTLAKKPAPV